MVFVHVKDYGWVVTAACQFVKTNAVATASVSVVGANVRKVTAGKIALHLILHSHAQKAAAAGDSATQRQRLASAKKVLLVPRVNSLDVPRSAANTGAVPMGWTVSLFAYATMVTQELIALLLALVAHPAHSMENAMQMVVSRSAFAKAVLPGKRAVRCALLSVTGVVLVT